MNRKSLVYITDSGEDIGCRNVSANLTSLGFVEDLGRLQGALPKPDGLKFRGVYATATSSGGIKVDRFYPVGDINADIYKKGGEIKQKVSFDAGTEELTFIVTSARGEFRKFVGSGDPGGPAPSPVTSTP